MEFWDHRRARAAGPFPLRTGAEIWYIIDNVMDKERVKQYRSWFFRFVQEHAEADAKDHKNIALKDGHTRDVCENSLRIAAGLGLDERETALAEVVALFHDVGRFPQFRRWRTFQDSRSVNHAVLGAKVLLERQVLRDLPKHERFLIVRAVALHNVFTLPPLADDDLRLHARIVRDADKLDIWMVFIRLLEQDPVDWPSAAGLGLSDAPELSPAVLDALEQRKMVRLTCLRTLNDFKLLQLAWIYDLNFAPSLRMVLERDVIDRLSRTVPRTRSVERTLGNLRQYVHARLAPTGE